MRWRWLERSAIVIAALATIATSKPRWHIDAVLPADDPTTARIVVVESAHQIMVSADGGVGLVHPVDSARPDFTWTGTGRYLVPAYTRLTGVAITGTCSGCGKCNPPANAQVRVVSTTPVAVWKLETTSAEQTTALPRTADRFKQHVATVRTSHITHSRVTSSQHAPHVADMFGLISVTWPQIDDPATVTWTLHTTIEGPCPDLKPCQPPADAYVSIGAITEPQY